MGPGLRARRIPFASWLAGPRSQGPRSLWPRSALEEPSRQRGALALGLVVGALGKPYASAQAGRVKPKPDLVMFLRELAALSLLASLALEVVENFFQICSRLEPSRLRYACKCFRACCSPFSPNFCKFFEFFSCI